MVGGAGKGLISIPMTVPFLDLQSPYKELQSEMDGAYQRVMNSGWYIQGEDVEQFERAFADYCGAKHCIGVGNGLEALHLILRGYGIGDEVIVHDPIHPHLSGAYATLGYKAGNFPLTEKLASTVLSLPIGPHLSESDQEKVVTAVQSFCVQASL